MLRKVIKEKGKEDEWKVGRTQKRGKRGYAISTSNKHEINKPSFQPRIDLSVRDNAPERYTPSELVKRRGFFVLLGVSKEV